MVVNQSQYPRKKQYMTNLNTLLDLYQNKSTLSQFKRTLSQTRNQNRPATMSLKRFSLNQLNNPMFKPIIFKPNDQFLNVRSTSAHNGTAKNKRIQVDPKTKTLQQAKKQKMISMLSTQNFRKQLMNTRKMSAVQTQYRNQQINKQKYKKVQHDLKFNMLRNRGQQQQIILGQQYSQQNRFSSQQLSRQTKRNKQQNTYNVLLSSQKESKKQYLKKNTRINKSILNSIIRLKLTRNLQQNDTQKVVNNQQIIKMIKVYKGIQPISNTNSQQKYQSNQSKSKRKTKQKHMDIQGWYHETENFSIHADVAQSPRQIQSNQL